MFSALLAAALVAGHGDPVVARVEGEPITATQLSARAEELGIPALAALETVIRESLLARAAVAEGLAGDPELRALVDAERGRLSVQQLLEKEVFPSIRATDGEIEALYHLGADQVRLSMVARATRNEAEGVLTRLRAGAALIDEAKGSPDPVLQAKSGVLGWVERGELAPALAAAAFAAPLDTLAGPIEVPKGYVVFVVHERRVGSESKIGSQVAELRQKIEFAKRDAAVGQFLAKLRKQKARADAKGPPSPALPDRKLLEDAAVARGLHHAPQVTRALHRFEVRLLASAYVRMLGDAVPSPSPSEVELRYREQGDSSRPPPEKRTALAEQMRRERAQAIIEARVNRLRTEASVVVDEAALAALAQN